MNTFAKLDTWLGKKTSRFTGQRGTRVRRVEGGIAVQYHDTDVVTHYADGTIVLNTDKYNTPTTRSRINQYQSVIHTFSAKGLMRWSRGCGYNAEARLFTDGLTIKPDGTVCGCVDNEAQLQLLRKRVRVFADQFAKAWSEGNVGAVSNGDCFFCLMRDVATGKPMPGGDHLMSHIAESYFVPSLLRNAMMEVPTSEAHKSAVFSTMAGQPNSWCAMRDGWVKDTAKVLRRYITRHAGLGEAR
jgi:hypothetical protein